MNDYILMISQTGQLLDKIGIVLLARLYHIHVTIVQDKSFGQQEEITIYKNAVLYLDGRELCVSMI